MAENRKLFPQISSQFFVSLDAATSETYQRDRQIGSFDAFVQQQLVPLEQELKLDLDFTIHER